MALMLISFDSRVSYAEDTDLPILNVIAMEEGVFSHRNENGEIVGENIEKVRAFLESKGIKYKFEFMPWQRLLRVVNSTNNALVLSMVRTEAREDNYIWLLRLSTYDDHLITRNNPEMINLTKEQILTGKYKAVCQQGAIQCQFLEMFGFSENRILRIPGLSIRGLAAMIIRGRADFMIEDMGDMEKIFKTDKMDINQLKKVIKIHTMGNYLAAPKNLDPRLKAILMRVPRS